MSGFKNHGVPWYAKSDTPAIRPRPMPEEVKDPNWRVQRMQAYQYVRQYIRDNWKDGDRFVYTTEELPDRLGNPSRSLHGGKTGTFKSLVMLGNTWWVNVEWDDPDYRPNTGKRAGMFDFYHFAFKPDALQA